ARIMAKNAQIPNVQVLLPIILFIISSLYPVYNRSKIFTFGGLDIECQIDANLNAALFLSNIFFLKQFI
ncbi:MAG: hypothetical protein ACO21S_09215, partial [Sediminibacterium sp.]